jgi:hypothetical protein
MLLLILCLLIAAVVAWSAWVFLVSPASDQVRIKEDQGGTDARVIQIERIGTRRDRPEVTLVAGRMVPRSGGGWYRLYNVTVARPDGLSETYMVGVEARLFGFAELKRIDWSS